MELLLSFPGGGDITDAVDDPDGDVGGTTVAVGEGAEGGALPP